MRHAITDNVGGRTRYVGALVAATATLSICLTARARGGLKLRVRVRRGPFEAIRNRR